MDFSRGAETKAERGSGSILGWIGCLHSADEGRPVEHRRQEDPDPAGERDVAGEKKLLKNPKLKVFKL